MSQPGTITGEDIKPLQAAINDTRRLEHILLHFAQDEAAIEGIMGQARMGDKKFHGILCLNGENPVKFVQETLFHFLEEAKRKPNSDFLTKGEALLPLGPEDPNAKIRVTKLSLEGTLPGVDTDKYSFHLFHFGEKVAEVRKGVLYRIDPDGGKYPIEDFSGSRDMELSMFLRCYVSDRDIVKAEGTLFSALEEKVFSTVLFEPIQKLEAFLVDSAPQIAALGAHEWSQDNSDLYNLLFEAKECAVSKRLDYRNVLSTVIRRSLNGTAVGSAERTMLFGYSMDLVY
ncbi:MAG: hypothetical protein LBJ70_03350 [Holosporales bacterium]|jgi:hypothetical protein|nr:hypothetical protein [Holosporales bacterium]